MEPRVHVTFNELKYKLYSVLIPVITIVTAIGYILEIKSEYDPINIIMSPLFLILFIVSYIILKTKVNWVPYIEKTFLIFICVMTIIKFTYVLTYEIEQTMSLGKFTFWMPLFFIFIFFMLEARPAVYASLATLVALLVVGIYHLPRLYDTPAINILIQYYTANFLFFITLYYLQTIKKVYIQSELLDEIANTDYLTTLPNRRKIDKTLDELLQMKHQNTKLKYSIIYLDIDDFKHINDTYGHSVGDSVLQEFTSLIRKSINDNHLFGRWGGEEFMIVCTGKNCKEAAACAEDLRRLIFDHHFKEISHMTTSIGVTEILNDDKIDTLLNRADKALYDAKSNGKNRVVMS